MCPVCSRSAMAMGQHWMAERSPYLICRRFTLTASLFGALVVSSRGRLLTISPEELASAFAR